MSARDQLVSAAAKAAESFGEDECERFAALRERVHNQLFAKAATSGDGFRQWFYPRLPASYAVNPLVDEWIDELYHDPSCTLNGANIAAVILQRASED